MSSTSDGASDKAQVGSASDNAEDLEQRIAARLESRMVEQFNKMLGTRLERQLEATFKKWADEAPAQDADKQQPANGGEAAGSERLSMKALENKIAELQTQIQKRDEEVKAERQRAIDMQTRGEVREKLAAVIGADNPSLPYLMDSLYDTRRRFTKGEDGRTLVKFPNQYGGDDDLLPLEEGLKKLAESDLKHLIPSQTARLPGNAGYRNGQVVQQQQAPGNRRVDSAINEAVSNMMTRTAGKPLK